VNERDHPFGASPRGAVHELDPVLLQLRQGSGQVVDDVTDMVERRFRVLGDELGDAGLAVGGLDELDRWFLSPRNRTRMR